METNIVPMEQPIAPTIVTGQKAIEQASAYAGVLKDVIEKQKLFTPIQGKKYVNVEGWMTLGALLGILPREVSVAQNVDGDYEATVELVRTSDGVVIGRGSAICGADEATWKSRPKFARRSMAITRATGKAFRLGFSWIIKMAGYEGTPAEEMIDVKPVAKSYKEPVTEEDIKDIENAFKK